MLCAPKENKCFGEALGFGACVIVGKRSTCELSSSGDWKDMIGNGPAMAGVGRSVSHFGGDDGYAALYFGGWRLVWTLW